MKSLCQLRIPTIDKWHAADNISDGTWQELLCFRKYMIYFKNKCTDTQIIIMTVESWVLLDIDSLETIHSLIQGAAITTPDPTPVTPSSINTTNVTPRDIDVSSFLKYFNVRLSGKSGVLSFYNNLYVQSKRFNIFLRTSLGSQNWKG